MSDEPAQQAQAPAQTPAQAPAQAEEAPKKVKPTNCAKCNKPLRKKIWYYRNGKYFCTKTCWQTSTKKTDTKTQK